MNILKLSSSYIFKKPLSSAFNFLLLSFGVALAVLLIIFSNQLEERFRADIGGVDLVVGAKGSPLQIILSSLLHVDIPTGNISFKEADKIAQHKLVASALPISLGDSYHGFAIMGVNTYYMTTHSAMNIENGYWPAQLLEAVIGADVAKATGLKKGDHFVGSHGFAEGGEEHTAYPYKVTGILDRTGAATDRLILTKLDTVSYIHNHDADEPREGKDKKITALLIRYKTPAAANILPQLVNSMPGLQAAVPAFEISRLLKLLGIGFDALKTLSFLLIGLAALSIFITLFRAARERTWDIAIMQVLGGSRAKIFTLLIIEGFIYSSGGAVIGIGIGHLAAGIAGIFIANDSHIVLSPLVFFREELYLFLGSILIGIIASLIPAVIAYRTDIAKILNRPVL